MKLKELYEMNAIAEWGDWSIGENIVAYRSSLVVKKHYEHIGKIKLPNLGDKKIYKLYTGNFFIVGDFVTKGEETKFEEIFQITFIPTKILNHSDIYMNVEGVKVPDTFRGLGIAISMYRFFAKEMKLNILGDETQYFGARKLWAKLSKMIDIKVDIIDITDGKLIEENVILRHGTDDWDFDDRVWAYGPSKKHIRLILKEIIE